MFKFIYEIHLGFFPLYLITSCLLSLVFGIAMSVEYVNVLYTFKITLGNIHVISYYFLSSLSIGSLGKGSMEMSKLEIV